jgi:predicted transcriptional regulator
MIEIKDLSTLLALLEQKPGQALEVRIDPQAFKGLETCLQLGIINAAQWQPAAFNPKTVSTLLHPLRITDKKMIVRVKDFQQFIDATHDKDATPLKVDKKLLDEGMGWFEEAVDGNAHFEQQIKILEATIKSAPDTLVDAPKNFLQELVDWLDQIQRNRPNEVAEELRDSVRENNAQTLDPKPKGPYDD